MAGTIGHKLMAGKPTKIDLDKDTHIDVRCQIHQLSFSPHTDAKGIMDLVKFLSPKHVVLVHGEKPKMALLKGRIQSELDIECYYPSNNETVSIPSTHYVKADASDSFIRRSLNPNFKFSKCSAVVGKSDPGFKNIRDLTSLQVGDERVAEAILVLDTNKKAKVIHQDELLQMLGEEKQEILFAYCCPLNINKMETASHRSLSPKSSWLHVLFSELSNELSRENIQLFGEHLQVESFDASICSKDTCPYRIADSPLCIPAVFVCCNWSVTDDKLAWKIISIMKNMNLNPNFDGLS